LATTDRPATPAKDRRPRPWLRWNGTAAKTYLYDIEHDLQAATQSLVDIVRNGPELGEALEKPDDPKERTAKVG
jgi:succinate dehydrogenase/fumarate reductase flavoprotein subunit